MLLINCGSDKCYLHIILSVLLIHRSDSVSEKILFYILFGATSIYWDKAIIYYVYTFKAFPDTAVNANYNHFYNTIYVLYRKSVTQ